MDLNDSSYFEVNLNEFNGPLNVLLDLAKAQKVDLEKISITKLADPVSYTHLTLPTRIFV